MIGAYIVLRCLELLGANEARFSNRTSRGIVIVMAALVMFLAVVSTISLLDSGGGLGGLPSGGIPGQPSR